jgi:hypothetical protein
VNSISDHYFLKFCHRLHVTLQQYSCVIFLGPPTTQAIPVLHQHPPSECYSNILRLSQVPVVHAYN